MGEPEARELERLRAELDRLRRERKRGARIEAELRERVKELNCLYHVTRILHAQEPSLEQTLRRLVEVIPPAWQRPDRTCTRIHLDGANFDSRNYAETPLTIRETLQIDEGPAGYIEVGFLGEPEGGADPFLDSERRLLQAVAGLIENMIVQRQAESALQRTAAELQAQKERLEQMNAALREILEQLEAEKREIKEQVAANVDRLVLPILRRLRDPRAPEPLRSRNLDALESSLKELASAYTRRIVSGKVRLSPREIEIAMRVRDGFSSKEIAEQLHISQLTVERHRHHIRRKFGIASEKVNLSTFLKQA